MRNRPLIFFELVLLICFYFTHHPPAHAQQQGITVYGRVFLPDSRPATQVTVNISALNGFNASAKTDARGGFRFESIPRSIFRVTVVLPHDAPYLADAISVDASRDGNSFMADVFLRSPSLEITPKKEHAAGVITVKEASQNIPKDARKALDKARKYREQKKFDAALTELDKAINLYPDYFQAFAEKGLVQINTGHTNEALDNFGRAIEIFPAYEPAVSGAGYCMLTLGKYDLSAALLEKAVYLDATRAQNLLFLGIANLALSRWQKAQEALERALKLNAAESSAARLYLADAFAGQRLYTRAADELRTYLQLNPGAPNADRLRQREKHWRAQKDQ